MAGVVGAANLGVSQHTHYFPQCAWKTHTYPQPTRYSLPFLGPARGDWKQGGNPCQNTRGHKDRPYAVLGSWTGAWGPRGEDPRSQGCGASWYLSCLPPGSPHPPPSATPSCAPGALPSQPPPGSWLEPAAAAAPLLLMSGAGPAPSRRYSGGMMRRLQRPPTIVASLTTEVPVPLPSPCLIRKLRLKEGNRGGRKQLAAEGSRGPGSMLPSALCVFPFHPQQSLQSLLYRHAKSPGLPGQGPVVRLEARSPTPAPALFQWGPILPGIK